RPAPSVLGRRHGPGHVPHASELDTRGAGRFAGPTVKGLMDGRLEARVVEGDESQRGLFDLPHATARAIPLVMQASEGWTFRQTEAAVDAVPYQVHVDTRRDAGHPVAVDLALEIERGRLRHRLRSRRRSGPGSECRSGLGLV